MGRFDKGVSYFSIGTVDIPFPEDDISCQYCPLMGVEMASGRMYCRRTGEILTSDKYKGEQCPVRFEDTGEGVHEEMED